MSGQTSARQTQTPPLRCSFSVLRLPCAALWSWSASLLFFLFLTLLLFVPLFSSSCTLRPGASLTCLSNCCCCSSLSCCSCPSCCSSSFSSGPALSFVPCASQMLLFVLRRLVFVGSLGTLCSHAHVSLLVFLERFFAVSLPPPRRLQPIFLTCLGHLMPVIAPLDENLPTSDLPTPFRTPSLSFLPLCGLFSLPCSVFVSTFLSSSHPSGPVKLWRRMTGESLVEFGHGESLLCGV